MGSRTESEKDSSGESVVYLMAEVMKGGVWIERGTRRGGDMKGRGRVQQGGKREIRGEQRGNEIGEGRSGRGGRRGEGEGEGEEEARERRERKRRGKERGVGEGKGSGQRKQGEKAGRGEEYHVT